MVMDKVNVGCQLLSAVVGGVGWYTNKHVKDCIERKEAVSGVIQYTETEHNQLNEMANYSYYCNQTNLSLNTIGTIAAVKAYWDRSGGIGSSDEDDKPKFRT